MNYRSYIAGDFDALYAVEEACFEPSLRFDRRYMRSLVKNSYAATWIAEEEGRLIGFAVAAWSRSRSSAQKEIAAYIETIEVLTDFRRRGVADELLRHIERAVCQAHAVSLSLHVDCENAGAIRLYQKHGFVALSREENFYPQGTAAILFRKQLQCEAHLSDGDYRSL